MLDDRFWVFTKFLGDLQITLMFGWGDLTAVLQPTRNLSIPRASSYSGFDASCVKNVLCDFSILERFPSPNKIADVSEQACKNQTNSDQIRAKMGIYQQTST